MLWSSEHNIALHLFCLSTNPNTRSARSAKTNPSTRSARSAKTNPNTRIVPAGNMMDDDDDGGSDDEQDEPGDTHVDDQNDNSSATVSLLLGGWWLLNQKFTETSRKHALSRPTTGFFVNDALLKYVMLCSLVRSHLMLWYLMKVWLLLLLLPLLLLLLLQYYMIKNMLWLMYVIYNALIWWWYDMWCEVVRSGSERFRAIYGRLF